MKKNEFLAQLKKALENELDAERVKTHTDYYEDYIQSELNIGKSEEEILEQLGDPWAIAKTILISEKMEGQEYRKSYETVSERQNEEHTPVESKWKGWLAILVLILAVILVLSIVFGVLALAIRFAVPIMLVLLVIKLISKK